MEINEKKEAVDILNVPVLPLRGLVLFPGTMLHFDVGRKKSILAMNAAVKEEQKVFLVAQKDIVNEEPLESDLCKVGVVAIVRQVLKQSGDGIRILVEGKYRASIDSFTQVEPFIRADVFEVHEKAVAKTIRTEALIRQTKLAFSDYLDSAPRISSDVVLEVQASYDPGKLADCITSNIILEYKDKQDIICELDPVKRLENLLLMLRKEVEILSIENEIGMQVKEKMDEHQREYFLREQIKVISEELGDSDNPQSEAEEFRTRIESLKLADEVKVKLLKECDRLFKMPSGSHEANVLRNYLDTCLELPWNKKSKINIDLAKAKRVLDKEHYGLEKVKDRIIEMLAVKKLAPDIKGQIICLIGPPGVGKTSIAKSVAKAIGCKYARVSLGGVKDEADIRGHRRTYIGSMPGRIITAIKTAGTKNPLLLLDEIDKLSSDFRGDPTSALLEVLDSEQNSTFEDHYIDLPFDLSEVFFITTANDYSSIPEPLLDRMELIDISSYTHQDKFFIAKKYLIPKQMKKHGIQSKMFRITDQAIHELIDGYTKEAGVRTLERTIATLLRRVAKSIVSGEENKVTVNVKNIESILGLKRFKKEEILKTDEVGLVNGLAWTSVGGQTMQIEVAIMDGNGKLELTGCLGDIMKESAKAAISCIRTRANALKINPDFYNSCDIHIHVPEGAIPKDGPSAGITMATALVSALTKTPVRHDIAMTGEITLSGRVLPIGGLKEKTMAAYRNGIKTVIIPQDNVSDLEDIDHTVKRSLVFIPASDVDTVFKCALLPQTNEIHVDIRSDFNNDDMHAEIPEHAESATVYA